MREEAARRADSLRRIPMLTGLAREESERLAGRVRPVSLPSGRELFHDGDPGSDVYWVLRGWLRVAKSPNGSRVVFELPRAGDLIGEVAVLGAGRRTATVSAVTDSSLLALGRREFISLVRTHPEIAADLLTRLTGRLARTSRLVEDVVFRGLPARLARCLIRLCDDHGEETADGVRIPLQLSQQSLGEMIGMSRESINKQIGIWQQEGLVQMHLGRLFVHDRRLLEALAA